MATDLPSLNTDIEAVRSLYEQVRGQLVRGIGFLYADGPGAAAGIIDRAEEFGPDNAVRQMLADPSHYGELHPQVTDQLFADQSDLVEADLERMLDHHDRLDELLAKRDAVLREQDPSHQQVLALDGQDMTVDAVRGEFRMRDQPEQAYKLPVAAVVEKAVSTRAIAEQFARETGADKAEPTPARDRMRNR